MNLKISRGEEVRKALVRYAVALQALEAAEKASEKYNEEHPFSGGGAYSDAGYINNPTRKALRRSIYDAKDTVEAHEKELRALALEALKDYDKSEKEEQRMTGEGYKVTYPFEIPQTIVDNFMAVLEGCTPSSMSAISMKFENPLVIDNLTRKLFSQEKTEKGRVFGYAVVRPEGRPISADTTVIVSSETPVREEIIALLPIGPNAQQNAVLFATANNAGSLFLQRYFEVREELDRRDRADAERLKKQADNEASRVERERQTYLMEQQDLEDP